MARLYNLARMSTATTGTGTLTLTAETGWLTFALAGVQNGEVVSYAIHDDGGAKEIGRGTYTAAGVTLSRDTVLDSTDGGAKISLSGSATVFITSAWQDLVHGPEGGATPGQVAVFANTFGDTLTVGNLSADDIVNFDSAVDARVDLQTASELVGFNTAVDARVDLQTASDLVGFGTAVDARVAAFSADQLVGFQTAVDARVNLVTTGDIVGFDSRVDALIDAQTAAELVGFQTAVDARVDLQTASELVGFATAVDARVDLQTAADLVGFATAVDARVNLVTTGDIVGFDSRVDARIDLQTASELVGFNTAVDARIDLQTAADLVGFQTAVDARVNLVTTGDIVGFDSRVDAIADSAIESFLLTKTVPDMLAATGMEFLARGGSGNTTLVGIDMEDVLGGGSTFEGFRAFSAAAQTGLTVGADTQVVLGTESYDVGAKFASNAWTPSAGKVFLHAHITIDAGTEAFDTMFVRIKKDGVSIATAEIEGASVTIDRISIDVSVTDVADGTDVYTVYAEGNTTAGGNWSIFAGTAVTYFEGWVIG